MNELITADQLSRLPPSRLPEALDRALAILNNGLAIDGTVPPSHALTVADKRELVTRSASIIEYLARAAPETIRDAVRRVMAALPAQGGSQADLVARVAIYLDTLRDMPEFAIVRVCDGFVRGRLGDATWCPSAGAILIECEKLMAPHKLVLDRILAAISAPVAETEASERTASRSETVANIRRQWGIGEHAMNIIKGAK